jgi:selenocysteine lyase/cysteine desulfurase
MLPSQRALFDLPREICYLNAAGWSPLPLAVQEAGRAGVARKGRPWELAPDFAAAQHGRARAAAARLINADPDDVASSRRWDTAWPPPARRSGRSPPVRACWCWRTTTPRPCWNG